MGERQTVSHTVLDIDYRVDTNYVTYRTWKWGRTEPRLRYQPRTYKMKDRNATQPTSSGLQVKYPSYLVLSILVC